ncbi:MAG: alpha/beta hydrolase [Gammaproteobacteria bacterium]
MQHFYLFRSRARRFGLLLMTVFAVGLPVGCSVLEQKERELVFRIEPGTASWFSGLPRSVEELQLTDSAFGDEQNIHAWWWPGPDTPVLLYLHGARWNVASSASRMRRLQSLGFSVLAIDYRGFGQSLGDLPSERSVYADARIGRERLKQLQPDASKHFIYGHSLGGAVAVDLAAELGQQAERDETPAEARALIIESTFTSLADVATAVSDTTLPVRWLLSQKFDSLEKIDQIGMPLLVVHGTDDRYVPPRFSEQLYEAARQPKQLLLVEGATHNNSLRVALGAYGRALQALLESGEQRLGAAQPQAKAAERG